jgi:hypothetical protein
MTKFATNIKLSMISLRVVCLKIKGEIGKKAKSFGKLELFRIFAN